jgi:hypothetical protein
MKSIWNGLWSESFQVKTRPGGRAIERKVVVRPIVISPIPPGREIQRMNYCGRPKKSNPLDQPPGLFTGGCGELGGPAPRPR